MMNQSLEHRMRDMILSNQESGSMGRLPNGPARTSPRPNQRQRRQGPGAEIAADFNGIPRANSRATKTMEYHSSRPMPHNRTLYDPRSAHVRMHVTMAVPVGRQNDYVETCAREAVAGVEIGPEELHEKETLRLQLQTLCRNAVAAHESLTNPQFAAESVQLVCFGSLATTFATKGSDMDLVLLSPCSIPSPAHPESPLPRLVEQALLTVGHGARLLSRTRVPIIKFCETPGPELRERLLETRRKWEEQIATQGKESEPMEVSLDASGDVVATPGESEVVATSGESQKSEGTRKRVRLEAENPKLAELADAERVRLYRLAMKEEWYDQQERALIHTFIVALDQGTEAQKLTPIRKELEQLPDVLGRHRAPPERYLDFPKTGVGVHCDINFQNLLALHNSALLRCYSLCDPRVRPMVLFVKAWAKRRKINSAYESTLSSYGYVLMVLHYLVNVASPPVLPNLQHLPLIAQDADSLTFVEQDGHNVRFFRNEHILRDLAQQRRLTSNWEPLGSLLRGFFQYFGSDGYRNFHWMRDCLSLRTQPGGILAKQSKGWTAAKTETMDAGKDVRQRYLIAIEDPFEIQHNVGRTVSHDGIVAIRDEFRRAHAMVQSAGTSFNESLMSEMDERGNLQYRHFGPRPRKLLPIDVTKTPKSSAIEQRPGTVPDTETVPAIPGDILKRQGQKKGPHDTAAPAANVANAGNKTAKSAGAKKKSRPRNSGRSGRQIKVATEA